jgi:2-dehydropantoate 2-reductase
MHKNIRQPPILQPIVNTQTLVPIQNGYDQKLEECDHPAEAIASFISECHADRLSARITGGG